MKKIWLLILAAILTIGAMPAMAEDEGYTVEENLDLYYAAREACLYMAAYDFDSIYDLTEILCMQFDLSDSLNTVVAKISDPDETMTKALTDLRNAYDSLIQEAEYDKVTFDIWQGHDVLPVPGTEIPAMGSDAAACLVDDEGYRPVLNDYRLDDPSAAKATLICVPSVRAYHSETMDFAKIFNAMGYNVLTLEPRFNKVEEGGGYAMLGLDAQRAIRYIRFHADELGIDADKLVIIAGSKGNLAHTMATYYYDLNPIEYCEVIGLTLENYTPDEIDEIDANVDVDIYNYGPIDIVDPETGKFAMTEANLYSEENAAAGLELPGICFLAGNNDGGVMSQLPDIIKALVDFNNAEDSLYRVNWEVHIMDGVPHGMGAATGFSNYAAVWSEVDAFIMGNID